MTDNILKILQQEQNIIKFIDENDNLEDPEIDNRFAETHYVEYCIDLLKKMNNNEVIEVLKRCEYINLFVDYKPFLKRYRIDRKKLAENPKLYLEEYNNLKQIGFMIIDKFSDNMEYEKYLQILDLDHAFLYLLKNMPNEDLNILAQQTNDWSKKLYYYSFLKKNKG